MEKNNRREKMLHYFTLGAACCNNIFSQDKHILFGALNIYLVLIHCIHVCGCNTFLQLLLTSSLQQYLFSKGTTEFLVETIKSLQFDKVLCVGVPR